MCNITAWFLPKLNALNVLKAIKGKGGKQHCGNCCRRPQRGHIYVAAVAAVGKRWRSFCSDSNAMFQKPKTVQNKCKAFAMLR